MKLAGAYINDDLYLKLANLADKNNRTIAGQCRFIFSKAILETSDKPIKNPNKSFVDKFK